MGRAPDRPSRSAPVNSATPVPMLLMTPRPVMTTRLRAGAAGSCPMRLGGFHERHDHLVRTLDVPHVRQQALLDGDMESALQRGQDLDSLKGVGFELVPEMAGRADPLDIDLEDDRDDLPDLIAQAHVYLFGIHLVPFSVDLASRHLTAGGSGAPRSWSRGTVTPDL